MIYIKAWETEWKKSGARKEERTHYKGWFLFGLFPLVIVRLKDVTRAC